MNYSLTQFPIFSGLSQDEIQNIEDFCQEKQLWSWEYLFHEGDEPQALYVLASWQLWVLKWLNKHEIAAIEPGSMIGEMAFFWDEKVRNASVVAKEDSELIVILAFSIVQLFWKYPELKGKLDTIIEERNSLNKSKGF